MSLTNQRLKAATAEAQRFIDRAAELIETDQRSTPTRKAMTHLIDHCYTGNPREQGAVMRASMDLTRALSDLRRRPSAE